MLTANPQVKANSTTTFVWRRFPRGAPPLPASTPGWSAASLAFGAATELEYGVTVGVPAAALSAAKSVGDVWTWDALTANPTVTPARVLSGRDASCAVPAYAAAAADGDASTPGLQHELKVSLRGAHAFSPVLLFASPATGAPRAPTPLSRDTALRADGFFTGDAQLTYEVTISNAAADEFAWRRYSGTPRAADVTDWTTAVPVADAVGAWAALDQGVYVRFESAGGKAQDLSWTFNAFPAWSTPFSPVAWLNDTVPPAAVPPTRLLPSGGLRASDTSISWTYSIKVAVGATFTWRKWPYGADAASPDATSASAALNVTGAEEPTALDAGVSVAWSNTTAVTELHVYQFTAFVGHSVTYGAASATGPVVAAVGNATGDPGAPLPTDAAGAVYTPAYTGATRMQFTVTVGADRASYTWSATDGVTTVGSEVETPMVATPEPLAQGVYVTWPGGTSGYTAANAYSFWAAPMPSSVAPPAPDAAATHAGKTFAAVGVFAPGGQAPTRDAAVTVEFLNGTFFAWRVDSGPFSDGIEIPAVTTPVLTPAPLNDTGLALTFSAASGYTVGAKHTLWVTSFVPAVANATSAHGGTRAAPALSQPVPSRQNRGSPEGLAQPYASNTGSPALGLQLAPTPGFAALGTAQGVAYQTSASGGLAAALPEGYPASVAPGAYPVLYLRIGGAPSVGRVTGPLPAELTVSGTYAGTSSQVYTIRAAATAGNMEWRAAPLGGQPGPWTADTLASPTFDAASRLTLAFPPGAAYPDGTAWTFVAAAGHTYAFRREGSARWSDERVIAPGLVDLCCGVSVTFDALSGYTPGDQWALLPFSVAPEGVYTGLEDAVFEVQVLAAADIPAPPYAAYVGAATGAAALLAVSGA
jgi:hypothetical protein